MTTSGPHVRPLKLCMVGCGGFARLCHGPAQQLRAAQHGDLDLAGCCDPDLGRAGEYRAQFGYARSYADAREMMDAESPDAVVVAVPPEISGAIAGPLLERGLPMLLEKPPGLEPSELDSLIAAAERGRARVQVGFNRRHMPVMRRGAALAAEWFAVSPPVRIDYEMVRHERWDADFSTTAVHAIDALLFLARSPISRLELRYREHRRDGKSATDVELDAETGAGTRLSLRILPVAGGIRETVALHGVGRSLYLTLPASAVAPEEGTLAFHTGGASGMEFPDRGAQPAVRLGICGEYEAFLDAVRGAAAPTPTLADCRQQVAIMHAIRGRRNSVPGIAAGAGGRDG